MPTLIDARCTVCGQESHDIVVHDGRAFCPLHLHAFYEDSPPVWRATELALLLILAAVIAVVIADAVLPDSTQRAIGSAIGAGFCVVPVLVWMGALYQAHARGRIDISPLLPTVLVLAALIAAALVRPFVIDLIGLSAWLARTSAVNRLLGNILIGGTAHAFVLYAVVRYMVWRTAAFSRRVDGILYCLAAGWGYSAAMNLLFVLDLGQISLLNGSLRLISHLSAYLATSLVIGLALGQNRFRDLPFYSLPASMTIAAALNGTLLFLASELNYTRLGFNRDGFSPWPGLIINLVFLLFTLLAVHGLLRRANAITRAQMERKSG